jgi:predicted nucleic acid-binding protein
VRVIVADTGPLQYLLLIGQIELLPKLYGDVTVPTAVHTEARARALNVIGTIGVLDQAARAGLVDIAEAVARLKLTNFRHRPALLEELLANHRRTGGGS